MVSKATATAKGTLRTTYVPSRVMRKKRAPRAIKAKANTTKRKPPQSSALYRSVGDVPFPAHLKMNMKYESGALVASRTVPVAHLFSANALFDPDITGTGHQPYYRDQMKVMYTHYRVHRVTMSLVGKQTTAGIPGFVSLYCTAPGTTSFGAISTFVENGTAWKMTKYDEKIKMTKSWNIWEAAGISKAVWLADEDYVGVFDDANKPTADGKPICTLTSASFDEFTTCNFIFRVTMKYEVECFGLKYLAAS